MEQELKKNGFNWQIYYKNVLKGSNHTRATIYVVPNNEKDLDKIIKLAKLNQNINWVVDPSSLDDSWIISVTVPNMLFLLWNNLPETEKIEYWKNIDFICSNENNYEVIIPALLSGVELINENDIENILEKDFILRDQAIARINAFEKGKMLLDTLSNVS